MSKTLTMPGPLEGVDFRSKDVNPPSNVYVAKEDALVITTYASVAGLRVDVRGRFLRADGVIVPIEISDPPNSDRTAHTTVLPLGEGFLLNLSVFLGSGTARRGQCYAQVGISRGIAASRFLHTILLQGYVGTGVNRAWPGDRLEQPTEGPGIIRSIAGTTPGVGAEISETVPTGARWRMLSLQAFFLASATVANRANVFCVNDAVQNVFRAGANNTVAASGSCTYYFAATGILGPTSNASQAMVPLPSVMILFAAYKILTSTTNLQAGDQWSSVQYLVEEWIEP